jgi:hypothetical protein
LVVRLRKCWKFSDTLPHGEKGSECKVQRGVTALVPRYPRIFARHPGEGRDPVKYAVRSTQNLMSSASRVVFKLDDSLRSSFGPSFGCSPRFALRPAFAGDDEQKRLRYVTNYLPDLSLALGRKSGDPLGAHVPYQLSDGQVG